MFKKKNNIKISGCTSFDSNQEGFETLRDILINSDNNQGIFKVELLINKNTSRLVADVQANTRYVKDEDGLRKSFQAFVELLVENNFIDIG